MKIVPALDHLQKMLPEPVRSRLLKDAVYELTGAWKFFTRLEAGRPALLFVPAFSALPLSFARHVARLDVLGPTKEEMKLMAELAASKSISNLRLLASTEALAASYATIILAPSRISHKEALFRETISRLTAISSTETEWWLLVRIQRRQELKPAGKKFLQDIWQRSSGKGLPASPRLCFAPRYLARSSQILQLLHGRALQPCLELNVAPDFASPKYVAMSEGQSKTNKPFTHLHISKKLPAEHVLLRFGNASPGDSFLERLLQHLGRQTKSTWQVGRQYRVLPGGKVQIALRHRQPAASDSALLKMPLIAFAAARLRENAGNLMRLAQTKEIPGEQHGLFPQILAEGVFETQAYYLETFLSGRSLDQLPATAIDDGLIEKIFALWLELQSRLTRRVKVSELVFNSVFADLSNRMQDWLSLDATARDRMQRVMDYWHQTFAGRELSLGTVHGDFSIKNILVDPKTKQITGIIDWDLTDFFTIPLLDVLHFFVRLDARSFQDTPPAIALRLVQDRHGAHQRYFHHVAGHHGYAPEDWPAVVMLYWLFRQRGYLGSPKNADATFVRRQFSSVLELFEREIIFAKAGVRA